MTSIGKRKCASYPTFFGSKLLTIETVVTNLRESWSGGYTHKKDNGTEISWLGFNFSKLFWSVGEYLLNLLLSDIKNTKSEFSHLRMNIRAWPLDILRRKRAAS